VYQILTQALPFYIPTSNLAFVWLKVGKIMRHTCISYFAKSKDRIQKRNKSYKIDQDVHV
jgi:hypothetical protein